MSGLNEWLVVERPADALSDGAEWETGEMLDEATAEMVEELSLEGGPWEMDDGPWALDDGPWAMASEAEEGQ